MKPLQCFMCVIDDAEYIVSGYAVCGGCYALWCEIPKDLRPYTAEVLEEFFRLGEVEGEGEDGAYIYRVHRAANKFRGDAIMEGRVL